LSQQNTTFTFPKQQKYINCSYTQKASRWLQVTGVLRQITSWLFKMQHLKVTTMPRSLRGLVLDTVRVSSFDTAWARITWHYS